MVKVRKVFSLDLSIAEEFQRHSEKSKTPMSWIVEYLLREYLRSKKDSRGGNHNHPPHRTTPIEVNYDPPKEVNYDPPKEVNYNE